MNRADLLVVVNLYTHVVQLVTFSAKAALCYAARVAPTTTESLRDELNYMSSTADKPLYDRLERIKVPRNVTVHVTSIGQRMYQKAKEMSIVKLWLILALIPRYI